MNFFVLDEVSRVRSEVLSCLLCMWIEKASPNTKP